MLCAALASAGAHKAPTMGTAQAVLHPQGAENVVWR